MNSASHEAVCTLVRSRSLFSSLQQGCTVVLQTEKELAAQKMTPEEVKRRQEAMAKNNALLFYQEQKAKRVKKIKSKAYHRHLKKQSDKAHAALGNNDLDDPDAAMVRADHGTTARC